MTYHLGDLAASERAQGYGYAAEYPSDTDKRIADCPTETSITALKQCIEKALTASRDAQRSEKDLIAQREMADWAFWVLIVSSVSAAITALGTAFLAIQIDLTRKAVKSTTDATDEMKESNSIARQTSRLQLMPYVFFDGVEMESDWKTNDHSVMIAIKNFGQTPALGCVVALSVGEVPYPLRRDADYAAGALFSRSIDIGPGQTEYVPLDVPPPYRIEVDRRLLIRLSVIYPLAFESKNVSIT